MTPSLTRGLAAASLLALAAGVVTACSSSAGSSPSAATAPSTSAAARAGANGFAGGRGPAASGLVAAIRGRTLQVQNPQSGQVAVVYTATTSFTRTVTTTITAVTVGACVTAIPPTGTAPTATSFTATRVTVSPAVDGECGFGFGGGGRGAGRSGAPGDPGVPAGGRPSGVPSFQRPTGFPSGGAARSGFGAIAAGSVTAVAGSTITVAARDFGSSGTTTKTVTVGPSTVITTTAKATAAALEVGRCITAQGKADTTGTVTATRIAVSDAVNGSCSTGFGFRRGN
ncbi:MAG: hypothetical protein ACTHMS_11415 [Jatrophihabitans sp.]|uniref:hypothetical protein n=1 Tax=Jatrophihabitans sp. TaxID=1932789 RepID=UPI003F8026C7